MTVTLSPEQSIRFLESELKELDHVLKTHGSDERRSYNAVYHWDLAKQQALQDLKSCIELFGNDFHEAAEKLAKKRCSERSPNYNPAQDKMNADGHWVGAYVEQMKKFSVIIPPPVNSTEH